MKSGSAIHPTLNEEECYAKLQAMGQPHLFNHYQALTSTQKENIRRQITLLDPSLFQRQQTFTEVSGEKSCHPFQDFFLAGNSEDEVHGQELVKNGKCALLVLAGGQGSRLRCASPKGCFPVTPIQHKSLFQFLAEKIKAASKQVSHPLEVAIMTSPLNHVEIQTFFAQHAFFGLDPKRVTFFYQRMWPFLNFKGELFLEAPDQIARGPNGNGGVLRRLVELDICEKWKRMGIEMVNVIPIDNPLADPFDYELFGFHSRMHSDLTVKSTWRRDAQEQVGVLATVKGKAEIIEYSELNETEKNAITDEGKLKFGVANLGLYCFSLSFIERVAAQELPLHRAKKAVKVLDSEGSTIFPEEPNAWKYEEFIFDVLHFADHVYALMFPRERCFAPLKNLKGEDSLEEVQKALLAFNQNVFTKITGNAPPEQVIFELSPQFYYPTPKLLNAWKGRSFPDEEYVHD